MNMLSEFLKNLEEEKVVAETKKQLDAGVDPMVVLHELQEGMRLVGEEYEAGRYFLSELIMSAEIFKQASTFLRECLAQVATQAKYGTLVIGTVKDDIHDIGKDIAATLLACQGFNVVDLGVDVPAESFVEAVKTHQPRVLGLSCLLTTAFDSMKMTIEAMEKAGLRNNMAIIIGGATIDEETRKYVNADAFTRNANDGVVMAQKLAGGAA